jgi:F-type H+-transporting ATPase subunit epsilon
MPLALSIVTPAHPLVETDVDSVVLPGSEGEFGVLPGHEALLAPLREGSVVYQEAGRPVRVEITGGFAEVTQSRVTVLADAARPASD